MPGNVCLLPCLPFCRYGEVFCNAGAQRLPLLQGRASGEGDGGWIRIAGAALDRHLRPKLQTHRSGFVQYICLRVLLYDGRDKLSVFNLHARAELLGLHFEPRDGPRK